VLTCFILCCLSRVQDDNNITDSKALAWDRVLKQDFLQRCVVLLLVVVLSSCCLDLSLLPLLLSFASSAALVPAVACCSRFLVCSSRMARSDVRFGMYCREDITRAVRDLDIEKKGGRSIDFYLHPIHDLRECVVAFAIGGCGCLT
jgi:hypothetical protein